MKKSKKILALLLAIVMIVTVAPLTVFAKTSGEWEYRVLSDGTAELTKYNGSAKNLIIPEKIDGYTVTSTDRFIFYNCTSLESITVPDNITYIGTDFGYDVNSLKAYNVSKNNKTYSSVDGVLFNKDQTKLICYPKGRTDKSYKIPNSVTSVGHEAFYSCTFLESVTIPNSVTDIGSDAFSFCTSLANIEIGNGVTHIGDFAFSATAYQDTHVKSGEVYLENYLLLVVKDDDTYSIREGTTLIADSAFEFYTSLKNLTIPNSVKYFGVRSLSCASLESVTISNGITNIGEYMFSGCTSLRHIVIPESVKSIGKGAFSGCSLESITIPNSVTSMGEDAFGLCTSLKKVTVGNGLKSINAGTFSGCSSLKSIIIPDNITKIGFNAFDSCKSLENVTIGSGVKNIESEAFINCTSLKSVYIPKNVTKIGDFAFGCVNGDGSWEVFFNISPLSGDVPNTIPDFIIYGEKGTEAERYAKDKRFKFIEIGSTEPKPGDISGDNEINASDAVMIQRYVAGIGTLSAEQLKSADLNNDGIVDEADAIKILRIDAGLEK